MRLSIACALLALSAAGLAQAAPSPVKLDSGLLQDAVEAGSAGHAIAYRGVPYAAPPVGPLRWRPPQPAASWKGVRQAAAFGAICPQAAGAGAPAGAVQSEDCLTLNVWTPGHAVHGAPVMVWVHGGGDDSGTASQPQFDGSPFARDGVVFVSVQYRLGALGWFAHPALTREAGGDAPLANYGMMDVIAALRWVQRNIRAFGGDPARVTLAGESAGGETVLFLMTTPAARGLFSQAIVESGSGWYDYPPLAQAEAQGVALARRAGAPDGADAAALRALSVSALLSAAGQGVGVTVDDRLVRATVARAFATGEAASVPLLIGSNNGEDDLLGDSDPKAVLKDYTPEQLAALRAAYGAETPDEVALGRAVFRDAWMGAPARWFAARQAARAPTFLYQFGYVPQALRSRREAAGHGFEMLFAFEALARAPIPLPATPADQAEMMQIHGCWSSFVKTGVPACPNAPPWPAYAPASDQLMVFGPSAAAVATGFRKAAYDVLDRIEEAGLAKPNPR